MKSRYDHYYFEKSKYDNYGWHKSYVSFAEVLNKLFLPKSVLDVGCAKGFLVKALRFLNVEAFGIDISEYAIEKAPKDVRNYVLIGDASHLPFRDDLFDLVTCFAVLEHIPKEHSEKVISELIRVSQKYIVGSMCIPESPYADKDATHVNIQSVRWWEKEFTRHGVRKLGLLIDSGPRAYNEFLNRFLERTGFFEKFIRSFIYKALHVMHSCRLGWITRYRGLSSFTYEKVS